jgi:hypothetical protein
MEKVVRSGTESGCKKPKIYRKKMLLLVKVSKSMFGSGSTLMILKAVLSHYSIHDNDISVVHSDPDPLVSASFGRIRIHI